MKAKKRTDQKELASPAPAARARAGFIAGTPSLHS